VLDFSEQQDASSNNPRCDTFEPNEVAAGAPQLAPGTNELALCGATDIDFFTLTVVADQDVTLMTTGGDFNIELALLEGGNQIQVSDAVGSAEIIERTLAAGTRLVPGEYSVRVQSVPPGQEGDYDLTLTTALDVPPDAGVDGS